MKTTLIKYGAIALAVLAFAVYAQYLRGQNQRLNTRVSLLTAINASNAVELSRLKALAALNAQITAAWELDRQALNELKSGLNTKIQKEMRTNEEFSDWACVPVPDAVNWMLGY